jgi:hypothetical protein
MRKRAAVADQKPRMQAKKKATVARKLARLSAARRDTIPAGMDL